METEIASRTVSSGSFHPKGEATSNAGRPGSNSGEISIDRLVAWLPISPVMQQHQDLGREEHGTS